VRHCCIAVVTAMLESDILTTTNYAPLHSHKKWRLWRW